MLNKISLSNRTLWFLILFWFISLGYLFYVYFFVYNLVSIQIISNEPNYQVVLYNKKLHNSLSYDCENKVCDINELSAFQYKLEVLKDWYDKIEKDINLEVEKQINIKLQKTISFEKLYNTWSLEEKQIEQDKDLKDNYLFINISNLWDFIFKESSNNKIDIYYNSNFIWSFTKVAKDKINLKEIYWTKDYIYLELGDKKYILNLDFTNIRDLNVNLNINYIKVFNDSFFQIVTEKWTFMYNFKTLDLSYFSRFYDFVYINWVYIAIINHFDTIRKQNMWYENNSLNLIVLFNDKTKEKRLLKQVDFDIKSIFLDWERVIFVSSSEDSYILSNF